MRLVQGPIPETTQFQTEDHPEMAIGVAEGLDEFSRLGKPGDIKRDAPDEEITIGNLSSGKFEDGIAVRIDLSLKVAQLRP